MPQKLERKLNARQIQMIGIGGAIGSGLFLGLGEQITMTGPSVMLSYLIGGLFIYAMMRALGEMAVDNPTSGAYMEYARQNLGHGAGFFAGWNTWLVFTMICMIQAVAAATLLDYWISIPHWITSLVLLITFGIINLISVKYFGEISFWFAGIKVVVIMLMIIIGTYLIFADSTTAQANWSEYQNANVFFSKGANGFILSLVMVIFAFGGVEYVSIAAGEAENPTRTMPKVINGVVLGVIAAYVLSIMIIIFLYPYQQINPKISPFTDVFSKLGFAKAADLINFVAITAILSSLNSTIYVVARFVYNLSNDGYVPKYFGKLSSNHIPARAVVFTIGMALVVVVANFILPGKVMGYLFSLIGTGLALNSAVVMITHLMFRRRKLKEGTADKLSYKMPGYPYVNIIVLAGFFLVFIIMAQDPKQSISVYSSIIWIILISIIYGLFYLKKQPK